MDGRNRYALYIVECQQLTTMLEEVNDFDCKPRIIFLVTAVVTLDIMIMIDLLFLVMKNVKILFCKS